MKQERSPRWTVMVFMGADNLPDEIDLTEAAEADIKEMLSVGSNESVNVFVQLHGKGTPQRHHIGRGRFLETMDVVGRDADPTDGTALISFLKWALQRAEHTKDDHSLLVLWGHAYRFGIGHTATRGGTDALDFAELAKILRDFQETHRHQHQDQYKVNEAPKLDIVGFDACDLATIEMAFQLAPFADYLIASQIGIPLPGWPYDRILERLGAPALGTPLTPVDLGAFIVRKFCAFYRENNKNGSVQEAVSLTLLDLTFAEQVFEAAEKLARKLALAIEDPEELDIVLGLFEQSQTSDGKPFVDVADLCLNLSRYCGDAAVGEAATALGDLIISPVITTTPSADGADATPRAFVVEHGRNAHLTARLHGVSLYAPHVAVDNFDWESASHHYQKFVFATATLWGELVATLAQTSTEVVEA